MISNLYLVGNALTVQAERQDVTADNLANVSTAGYKRLRVGVRSLAAPRADFPSHLAAALGDVDQPQVLALTSHRDTSPGELQSSGNPGDLALSGPGYFAVLDQGQRAYTRNGSFRLDANSQLTDGEGRPVLGERGQPLTITGSSWSVAEDGTVTADDAVVDRLLIVDFPAELAVREGDSLLRAPQAAVRTVLDPHVQQGYVEASNVKPIEEMVQMITDLRSYETAQRLITTYDQMLDRAVNEVGRT